MESPLLIRDLDAWYGSAEDRVDVFRSVSLEVRPGEILGVFGPNGCGKTTLLRVIAGLNQAFAGTVILPERNGSQPSVATIPQDYRSSFFSWANLQHNLELTSDVRLSDRREALRRINDVRSELDLELDLRLRPGRCSGGMLQQAAIIRALENNPTLVLADEPFSALDVAVASRVRHGFSRLIKKRGIAAVLVLHQLQDIVEVCDSVLVIPGRPFSTTESAGVNYARVLENEMRPDSTDGQTSIGFIDLAHRVLSTQARN